jgi:drug/metabolite transporter (DMT)-like permease
MNKKNKDLVQIHFAVLLFGISGLFGKLVLLPSIIIVLGRVFFSSIFLYITILYLKKDIKLNHKQDYVYLSLMGVILAIHWSTFFQSIQMSTVAIGLLTFCTFPVFVSFLEPYFFKEKIKLSNCVIAIITLFGATLVIPSLKLGDNKAQGFLWGMTSSFAYAILSMLNRKYVREYSSIIISFYEQFVATIILIPFLFIQKPVFRINDILLLILLGVVFTAISHSLFINGLKNVKVQTASIISSLEPVYGIIFAIFLLGEFPTLKEIFGGIIILGAAFYSSIRYYWAK